MLVALLTVLLIGAGIWSPEAPAGRRLSRPFAAAGRDRHPVAGACGGRGGAADHRADGGRDERHPGLTVTSARSRSTACPTSASPSSRARTATSRASRCSSGCRTSSCPTGVDAHVAPLSSPSGLIYRYVLESPDRSPMELKTFEDWVVERQYKSVSGRRRRLRLRRPDDAVSGAARSV